MRGIPGMFGFSPGVQRTARNRGRLAGAPFDRRGSGPGALARVRLRAADGSLSTLGRFETGGRGSGKPHLASLARERGIPAAIARRVTLGSTLVAITHAMAGP